MENFEQPREKKTPLDALVDFARGTEQSEGLSEADIRIAAQITLNKREEELTAEEAGSPDTELAETLKEALKARHGIPPGPKL